MAIPSPRLCAHFTLWKILLPIGGFLFFGWGTLYSSLHRLGSDSGDFHQFIGDGRLANSLHTLGSDLPLEYPPTARPLFMLMALPPPRISLIIWWCANAVMYWQSAMWLVGMMSDATSKRTFWRAVLLIALAGVGVVSDMSVGQFSGLILFSCVAGFHFDLRERPFLAGALLSLSLLIKPLPLVLLFYYAVRRRWRTLFSTAAAWLVLGPIFLLTLFGWEKERQGWQWFAQSTMAQRSPLHVFDHWAAQPGSHHTYLESGLSSSLIRLFLPVNYDRDGHSVQIASLPPNLVLLIWLTTIAVPLVWATMAAWPIRGDTRRADFHLFAAFCGIMLLANPKFISYWLALPMICIAPLVEDCFTARQAGQHDRLCYIALFLWLIGSATVAWPALRAAGSFPLAILVLTVTSILRMPATPAAEG